MLPAVIGLKGQGMAKPKEAVQLANELADSQDCDVFVYSAPFERGNDMRVIGLLGSRQLRKNALLFLTSNGGDADAAYRIARAFQNSYDRVTAIVPGWCKSAGTLCVLGAHDLVVGDYGELGPLDVQLRIKDEIGEFGSGLAVIEALSQLQYRTFQAFEGYMLQIKQRSFNAITFKLAAELAAKMAVDLHEPISRQIDPVSIGDQARAITIARDYGLRLQIRGQNFTAEGLELLVEDYPSHGFVIDRLEASQIFKNVREPSDLEKRLALSIGDSAFFPGQPIIDFYSDELEIQHEQPMPDNPNELPGEVQKGGLGAGKDEGDSGGAKESPIDNLPAESKEA